MISSWYPRARGTANWPGGTHNSLRGQTNFHQLESISQSPRRFSEGQGDPVRRGRLEHSSGLQEPPVLTGDAESEILTPRASVPTRAKGAWMAGGHCGRVRVVVVGYSLCRCCGDLVCPLFGGDSRTRQGFCDGCAGEKPRFNTYRELPPVARASQWRQPSPMVITHMRWSHDQCGH